MNTNYNYSKLQNIDSENKTLNLLGIAYNMKQIIYFNDDGFDNTFGPIKNKDLPKSTPSQYRSHVLSSIINLEKEEENYINSYTAAILAENDKIREAINSILREITKEKGFVVVGRDVTFNILPKAEVKILLSADLNIRALRRAQQLDLDNITNNILLDIINRDSKSFTLFTEAKRVSKLIDTTELTLADVVDLILTQKLTNEEGKAIRKQQISNEEIELYIEMKNWKLLNKVDIYAFEIAFHKLDERLNFMRKLLECYNACVTEIKNIESKIPKNRNHSLFFKAKTWCEKILKGPKAGALMAVQYLEQAIENLENDFIIDNEE
ncbi:20240_t:CDS:2 [Gigaspora margarita]|uniref:(d)CMP kinase n=1 Tax=Gigaspora margarita TaxID=4874 RepID=A0ABN7W416_GIGMA|nr:20240_t:CDS:2 [Gigaspora margarita]